jgi:hypothetical protein
MESQESSEAWSSLSMPSNVQSLEDSSNRNDAPAECDEKPIKDFDNDQSSGEEEIESPLRPSEAQEFPTGVSEICHAHSMQRQSGQSSLGGGVGTEGTEQEALQETAAPLEPGGYSMQPDTP